MTYKEKVVLFMFFGGVVGSATTCLAICADAPRSAEVTISFISFSLLAMFTLSIFRMIKDEKSN